MSERYQSYLMAERSPCGRLATIDRVPYDLVMTVGCADELVKLFDNPLNGLSDSKNVLSGGVPP